MTSIPLINLISLDFNMRYLSLLLVLISLFSCSPKHQETNSIKSGEQDESQYDNGIDGLTYWTIGEYVDNFGDITGHNYVTYDCYGKFSNSVADNDSLKVNIVVDLEDVKFKLYEYGTQLLKNRGILFVAAKLDNGEIVNFALNNEALGDSRIIKSTASAELVRNLFLTDGIIKFHIVNDKIHPTREYNFIYDGMSWDFESVLCELI